jgi:hypothetical protein
VSALKKKTNRNIQLNSFILKILTTSHSLLLKREKNLNGFKRTKSKSKCSFIINYAMKKLHLVLNINRLLFYIEWCMYSIDYVCVREFPFVTSCCFLLTLNMKEIMNFQHVNIFFHNSVRIFLLKSYHVKKCIYTFLVLF